MEEEKKIVKNLDEDLLKRQIGKLEATLESNDIWGRVLEAKILGKSIALLVEVAGEKTSIIPNLRKDIASAISPPYGKVDIKTAQPGASLVEIGYLLLRSERTGAGKTIKLANNNINRFFKKRLVDAVADVFDFLGTLNFRIAEWLRNS